MLLALRLVALSLFLLATGVLPVSVLVLLSSPPAVLLWTLLLFSLLSVCGSLPPDTSGGNLSVLFFSVIVTSTGVLLLLQMLSWIRLSSSEISSDSLEAEELALEGGGLSLDGGGLSQTEEEEQEEVEGDMEEEEETEELFLLTPGTIPESVESFR